MTKSFYQIGLITGPYGIKGDVKMRFFGSDPNLLPVYKHLWIDDSHSLTIEKVRVLKQGWLTAHFEEISTRTQAEALGKTHLHIQTFQLVPLEDPDIFYHQHLIGCEVWDYEECLGHVKSVENYGGDDILEWEKMRIVFRKEAVLKIDLETRKIWINPDLIVRD